jgi:tRNA(Ile)-lysidine synthase TilS/MesJ
MNNQSLGNLGKMHVKSGVDENGLHVIRLLIGKMKKDIYAYAEENDIFYFKDSTPKWSKRGKIRDNVLPQLENAFPGAREQLLRFNNINNSNQRLLQIMLADYTKFDIREKEDGTRMLCLPCDLSKECPFLNELGFWKHIFTEATKKLGCDCISQKSLEHFMQNVGKGKVMLSKNIHIENDEGQFTLLCTG